jgi:hypothetical protein
MVSDYPHGALKLSIKLITKMEIRCSIYTFEFDYFCGITRGEYEKTSLKWSMLLAGLPDA